VGRTRCILQRFGQRREVLRSIRSPADSYTDSYTDAYGKSEPYSYSMHREMHTNAKAASYSRSTALAHYPGPKP